MVTLVGAGPGDKGLLTLKGAGIIGKADVVLYDRFVSDEILAMIPVSAEKIDVGKTAGSHPVPQKEINLLLLERAKEGLNVVRLKGGDPFVFGRGGEELELLAENGIPFEVVPGITTAVAGPAYAGIPVTHREFASSLHIVTGHAKNNEETNIKYDALVRAGGTLVFMMGVGAVGEICAGCIEAGMDEDTPAAIVENATTNKQRKFIATVRTLAGTAIENHVESPAVIVIGKVCCLSERYDWFSKKPLLGKRIIVARAKPGPSKLSERLREQGCEIIELPGAEILPLTGRDSPFEQALQNLKEYSWLVFTSSIGVDVFFNNLISNEIDVRSLSHLKIACVGTETEREIKKFGINADYRPDEFNGAALARGLSGLVKESEKVLIARAKDGAEELTTILSDAGVFFNDVAVYEKKYIGDNGPERITGNSSFEITCAQMDGFLADASLNNKDVFAAFTSSSAVEWFAEVVGNSGYSDIGNFKAICIGERTAATAKSYGMDVFVSQEATIKSLVEKAKEVLK
jgi:uroporphyrinogen III methyltransferase/synthase